MLKGNFAIINANRKFLLRCLAAVLDFLLLAIPVAVAVSFYSVFTNISLEFLRLTPGESPAEVAHSFGQPFLYALLMGYIVCNWLYFALCESSVHQATPGKRLCGLYVADQNHRRISTAQASLRFFTGRPLLHIPIVGWLYFGIDCLFAAVPPRYQALHDRAAHTQVLKRIAI
jgi:uncharacterized RDD family membrane protein YckC